jgi:hypothetical protein
MEVADDRDVHFADDVGDRSRGLVVLTVTPDQLPPARRARAPAMVAAASAVSVLVID